MRTAGMLLVAVVLMACSDDPQTSTAGGGGAGEGGAGAVGGTGGSGALGGAGGSGGEAGYACNPPNIPEEGITETVGTVSGTVLDLTGAPAVSVLADVCGTNICIASSTDGDGDFTAMGMMAEVVDARLVYGDGLTHAKMAGRVPSFPNADVGTIHTPRLPPLEEGAPIVAGEDATQNGVTLHVPAGAQIDHDILLYSEDERGLRVTLFTPSDGNFPAIPASLNLELVIGLAPLHSLICPGVGMTFPNQPGWAAGAAVEVLYNNVEIYPSYAPYGGWEVVAEATVSDDGATISTDPGESIAELGTFGARLAH